MLSLEYGLGGLIWPAGRCGPELPTHGLLDVSTSGGELFRPAPRGLGSSHAWWWPMQRHSKQLWALGCGLVCWRSLFKFEQRQPQW